MQNRVLKVSEGNLGAGRAGSRTERATGAVSSVSEEEAHELVQRLFGTAASKLDRAQHAVDETCREAYVIKVVDILRSLQLSLDLERGGDLAANLDALYSYMLKRLTDRSEEGVSERLREVRDLVGTLKEAWEAIQPSIMAQSA